MKKIASGKKASLQSSKLRLSREAVRLLKAGSLPEVVGGMRPHDTCDMGHTCIIKGP
jgi:hypothetical protein